MAEVLIQISQPSNRLLVTNCSTFWCGCLHGHGGENKRHSKCSSVVSTCSFRFVTFLSFDSSFHRDLAISCVVSYCTRAEDAYRIDVEVDKECVGLDILDTAGQVRNMITVVERERDKWIEREVRMTKEDEENPTY